MTEEVEELYENTRNAYHSATYDKEGRMRWQR